MSRERIQEVKAVLRHHGPGACGQYVPALVDEIQRLQLVAARYSKEIMDMHARMHDGSRSGVAIAYERAKELHLSRMMEVG